MADTQTTDRRWLIRATAWLYEPLRRFFSGREGKYQGLRADLNAARMPVTVDDYLARSVVLAQLVGIVAGAVGLGVGLLAATNLLVTGLLAVSFAAGSAVVTWYGRQYLPRRRAANRAQRIDLLLPAAITYMYALSRGGLNLVEILRRLAQSEDTYGEVAREAGLVINQMDYLGRDVLQAVREASEITPSTYASNFFSDLLGVVESGGDVEAFLADRREEAVQDARVAQEGYIETIALFAEVYVTLLIAGPLFTLILLMVIGITGGSTLPQVNAVVYVLVPLASLLSLLVLDYLGAPFRQTAATTNRTVVESPAVPDDPDASAYAARKRRTETVDALLHPIRAFRRRPSRILAVSIPLGLLVAALPIVTGAVSPVAPTLYEEPLVTSTLLGVVPFAVAVGPYVVFYELRQRRTDAILERFPDILSSIASANRIGIGSADAIATASERGDGPLAAELRRVHNETEWFSDLQGALLRLANRTRTRITTRTLRLVVEADRASGDLAETLAVAAEDARTQREFARERASELSSYVAAAVIAFLVYLAILVLVNEFYFEEAIAISETTAPTELELPISLASLDADGFKVAFIHSSLVQGLFIGLMAGKMSSGRARSGLKYSLLLMAISLLVFGVI